MFPWEQVDGVWAPKSEGAGLIIAQLRYEISNLCDQNPPTSQTDRHIDDMRSQYRALHYIASRGIVNVE